MRNLGCPRRRGKLRAWWIGLCRRNRLETYPKLLSEDAMAEYSAVEEEGSTSGISGNIVGKVRELVKATMRSLGQLVSHAAVIWPAKKVTELAGFWSRSEQEYMVRD